MKKTVTLSIAAALFAVSPVAFAADTTKIASGVGIAALGGYFYADAFDDRDEELASCPAGNVCSESAFSAAPVKSIGGILGIVGGLYLIFDGFTDEEGESFVGNKWYDGMSFHTDGGKMGLQKKWNF